jgi:hypothetical protein
MKPAAKKAKLKAPKLAEIDRIALILWHSSQLTPAGRTYVIAALATADAILNGHRTGEKAQP